MQHRPINPPRFIHQVRRCLLPVFLLGLMATGAVSAAASVGSSLTTTERHRLEREARLVIDLLQNYQYAGQSYLEIENKEMVARFVDELDPWHGFLSTDDVSFIHERFDHSLKSVYLLRGDLQPAFEIFDLYAARARDRFGWIDRQLQADFDFSTDETYTTPAHDAPPLDPASLNQWWMGWIKEQVLEEMLAGREQAAARTAVAERYRERRRQLAEVDALTVRERFFDSVIRAFDPHSGYFSPASAREFADEMENAMTGVGLVLRKENGQCVVAAVPAGGPADLHSEIRPGDVIIQIAEAGGAWTDVARKPWPELTALVRPDAGKSLRLAYHLPGQTARQEVTLQAERVLLGEGRARGAVAVVPGRGHPDRRIGWITLPTFYAAGEGASATSATRDVRDLLGQMKAGPGIDGLVIDLRDNPGGTLAEAVSLTGLFLSHGSVVLCRGLDGAVQEMSVPENGRAYAGPVVILTSPRSASASEVFASAMQCHRRGFVVGAASTFGKGTVQNYIPLAKAQPGLSEKETADWGTLRLTFQRFYRADGASVQRVGVVSDFVLPDDESGATDRETDLPHAFAVETISPPDALSGPGADEATAAEAIRRQFTAAALADTRDLPEWRIWHRESEVAEARRKRRQFTLNLAERLAERDRDWTEADALVRNRRELAGQAAFPTEPVELDLLKSGQEAHEARLREIRGPDGMPLVHRLYHGSFTIETDRGHLRRLSLAGLDFESFHGDAPELARAFSSGSGAEVSPASIQSALAEIGRLKERTDEAVLAAFAGNAPATLTPVQVRKGTEQLLQRLTEIDPELRSERPLLDVPLRECLRLAADWSLARPAVASGAAP